MELERRTRGITSSVKMSDVSFATRTNARVPSWILTPRAKKGAPIGLVAQFRIHLEVRTFFCAQNFDRDVDRTIPGHV
jgi:cephalosporin-C deacetylase-like acetyl esterase